MLDEPVMQENPPDAQDSFQFGDYNMLDQHASAW